MAAKEAKARIKINRLLEEAGWRFFDDKKDKANIVLEPHVAITKENIDALGKNFEKTSGGYIDFLLLDERGHPLLVLEAKSEDKEPLAGKEQAREYARGQNCRFIILSNGNLHYFWDLEQGNPKIITCLPTPESVKRYQKYKPNPEQLTNEQVGDDYIVLTQMPDYKDQGGWKNEDERPGFVEKNQFRFLREYQERAVHAIQSAVKDGKNRFLFEMATGTGKTLTSAAVIKLFLRTGNAHRVLFLVDRLELEKQAYKSFTDLLRNDYTSTIYKEKRDDWRKAEIVVTTVQSLLFNNKYRKLFSPTDFDLVISDEAHRSINGNSRAVFEYFVGYKLGLTATPKDYIKKVDTTKLAAQDPREQERRLLLDTYRTFGCESGEPTFRYSLLDGVSEGFLVNPITIDARTEITTELLSKEGYSVLRANEEEDDKEQIFHQRDFERKFFSEATNRVFCEILMEHALRDPISGEIGKTIVFAVSQKHAAKIAQILNEIAARMFPGKYRSDFAIQVTSHVRDAQQFTINFANNKLRGSGNFIESYKTSKARICVTVGMMTTGYDCTDILNLGLMRPIFSPSDFVQMKGRGTRRHNFLDQMIDPRQREAIEPTVKTGFKLFDFFANCEYFEEKFNYDEILKLPQVKSEGGTGGEPPAPPSQDGEYVSTRPDVIETTTETQIGPQGMRIDRMFFNTFEEQVKGDQELKDKVENQQWGLAEEHVRENHFDKPKEYFNPERLRRAVGADRRLSVREILEKVFGLISRFQSKDELLETEFEKFIMVSKSADVKPEEFHSIKDFFKAYIEDSHFRDIIDNKRYQELDVNPGFGWEDFQAVREQWRQRVVEYIKDYVPLNQFM